MSPLERAFIHGAALLAALTGGLQGGLKYFGARMGEFGPEPHPWLGVAQHLHVLAGPCLVFALGLLVKGHVLPRLGSKGLRGRGSGLAALALCAPMVLAGYGVQISVAEGTRTLMAWIHGLGAGAFVLAYGGHLLVSRGRASAPAAAGRAAAAAPPA